MKVRYLGDSALLVETGDAATAQQLRRVLLEQSLPGLRQLVPGAGSLLIAADPLGTDLEALARRLPELARTPALAMAPRQHEFGVRYDGADVRAAAQALVMDADELVRRHAAPLYTVAFLGFAPGFPYLMGLDPLLRLPRHADPRSAVPPGAVAVAGEFCGIYPQATPGGWHVLGRCEARLFDPDRDPPALLAPGDRVRFRVLP